MSRLVRCIACGSRGWTLPRVWMAVTPPPPTECSLCGGAGTIMVRLSLPGRTEKPSAEELDQELLQHAGAGVP